MPASTSSSGVAPRICTDRTDQRAFDPGECEGCERVLPMRSGKRRRPTPARIAEGRAESSTCGDAECVAARQRIAEDG